VIRSKENDERIGRLEPEIFFLFVDERIGGDNRYFLTAVSVPPWFCIR
jgi:hypothetical protein